MDFDEVDRDIGRRRWVDEKEAVIMLSGVG